jgi:hypothetical protein
MRGSAIKLPLWANIKNSQSGFFSTLSDPTEKRKWHILLRCSIQGWKQTGLTVFIFTGRNARPIRQVPVTRSGVPIL